MPQKCCRSCPRCADCPALQMKQRRFERLSDELVTSVLIGAPSRELPAGVLAQLDALTAARMRPAAVQRIAAA
jgi:hypothetical protein